MRMAAVALVLVALPGCETAETERQRHRAEVAEHALSAALTCADEAVLLASTSGSPDDKRCSNKDHTIEATPVSAGTEEVGAIVVCRCRPAPPPTPGGKR